MSHPSPLRPVPPAAPSSSDPTAPAPTRRGPHPLLALAAYSTLILVAVLVVLALTTCGRVVDGAV